jgi:hypothetical protein
MKAILTSVCLLLALSSISPTEAKRCIKGGVAGRRRSGSGASYDRNQTGLIS